jgi:polyisoprenoid-binding protein YceI
MSTTTTAPALAAGTWQIDPAHSSAGFSVKHMGIATVRGRFGEFAGELQVDDAGAVRVEGAAEVASVDTGNEMRDNHLRSADFFDAGSHPRIAFRSTAVRQVDEDTYEVTGDITIRGVTGQVVLTATVEGAGADIEGNERVALSASGVVTRTDYGLTWNQTLAGGNLLVGEKVKLALDISAVRSA